MSINDFCRCCKKNLRIHGQLSSTINIFEKKSKCECPYEQVLRLGLQLHNKSNKSYRMCRSCNSLITRLERDMPVFKRWTDDEGEQAEEACSSEAPEKRDRQSTPSKTPMALKKFCPNPSTPTGTKTRRSITEVVTSRPQMLWAGLSSAGTQATIPSALQGENTPGVFAEANISIITGCNFQIFNGPVKIFQGSQKKQRFVMEIPSSSLRLWVPPLRLLSAFMWQVAEQRRVEYYTRLEEFVSVVLEMVPDLMTAKERVELLLGLRATFILELCHDQPSLTLQIMQPHLESISLIAESASIDESGDRTGEVAVRNFVDLIQTLLRSPTYRWQFFKDIYPLHYGPKYDTALQSLVWEFLCRLEKLLPVPSFHQAAYWFNEDSSLLDDSLQIVSDPKKIKILLLHFKCFAHLDPGSSSSPIMADTILSTLSGKAEKCLSTPHETKGSMNEAGRHGDMNEEDRHGDVDEGDIQTELDKEDRHGDLDEGDIQTELDKEDRHGDVDEGDIQTELDKEDRHGDVDEGDIQTELDEEDRHGDVDERDPQRDIDQGWQRDMNEKHQQKVEKKELNGHMIDCENAVDDRGAREVPTSSGEGTGVSSPQSSLPERASQSVNTVAGSASQLLRQVCTQCGKTYLSKSCLIRHQRTHTEEKKAPQLRLTCLECGKSFESKRTLTDHQTTHTGERPYLCSYCGKTFRRKNILTCHIRVHTGERPYGCSVCGRRFMQHSNLVSHKRLHTGERPYLCSFCGKGFPVSGALLVHTRNHTGERPYKCEFCGKGFMDSSRLVKHRRLHTKEKPYVCSVCKKQFWLVSGLKKHMRTHTGEKPHECLFYGKRFSERGEYENSSTCA